MKIALDVMGGDFAPFEQVKGTVEALSAISDLSMVLVGKEEQIKKELLKYKYDENRVEIVHTDEVIAMDEKENPVKMVRQKKRASMNVALELVKEGKADGVVSAGNTGALMSASLLKLGRIKGVLRPAISAVIPSKKGGVLLMDAGANIECKPEFLNQFAVMGSYYTKVLLKKENPTVGLLNIGEESSKGNKLTKDSYKLLDENSEINFFGNIEAREIMAHEVDVVVTDGFTGNMVLKMAEGTAKFIMDALKEMFKSSLINKIAAFILMPALKKMKKKLDSRESGGALFLGLDGISVKAHGNSDAEAIKNAIKLANFFATENFIKSLREKFSDKEGDK